MVHIHELPPEIIDQILFYLNIEPSLSQNGQRPYHFVKTNVKKFCSVSRHLLPQVQACLYSSFSCIYDSKAWTIRAFLRTISRCPALALHVKEVQLSSWRAWNRASDEWDRPSMWDNQADGRTERYDKRPRYSAAENNNDRRLFRRLIKAVALSDKQFWHRIITKDIDEVYVALLILALPSLRSLWLMVPSMPEILAKALYHATVLRPVEGMGLQQSQHVSYYIRGNVSTGDIADIAPFFRLPIIQRVSLESMRSVGTPWPTMPEPSNVQHLEIHDGAVEASMFEEIFSSTPQLKTLRYRYLWDRFSHNSRLFQPRAFADALRVVKSSLEKLELHVRDEVELSHPSQSLGSLRDFSRLRILKTPVWLLLGPSIDEDLVMLRDILPESLERFQSTELSHDAWSNQRFSDIMA